jgi:hypothetical protein
MFKMFLDVHAHSAATSIFIYSPLPPDEKDIIETRRFSALLDDASDYFLLENCRFNNEKYKRNCARLGISRDWNLINSYTIESSCFGFEIKDAANKALPPEEQAKTVVAQFMAEHFIQFGE